VEEIVLEFPSVDHEDRANRYKEEFLLHNELVINGSALFDQMDYKEWLDVTRKNHNPKTIRKDWVSASTFFAVRKTDEKIIGMIDVRHSLDNEFLANFGGHIGYSVRPSERRKGYATKMLTLALQYAKTIGLSCVMLGCYSDNEASIKTILKFGGVLDEIKPYADGKTINVYWINLY
jgi:predicted acetyltransferase